MNLKAKVYTRANDSGTHYARVILPRKLRAFVAKPAVWRSLSTKDDAEARKAGIATAAATRMVFQEVSDAHLEKEEVIVEIELVGVKVDMDAIKGEVDQEELLIIAESLRLSFGVPSKGAGSPGNPSGGTNKPTPSSKTRGRGADKVAEKKSDAGEPILMIQTDPAPMLAENVADYIEQRPHGFFRFRYWIPRQLQKLFGQREVRCTLGTKDRAEAIAKALPVFMELREKLQQLQRIDCSA